MKNIKIKPKKDTKDILLMTVKLKKMEKIQTWMTRL